MSIWEIFAATSAVKRMVNSAPTSAVPTEAPICRKKLLAAVAVPTMAWGNSFCTTSTSSCIPSPMPKPSTKRYSTGTHSAVCTSRRDSRNRPTALTTHMAISMGLQRPVFDAIQPLAVDVMRMPALVAVHTRPATSGARLSTIWK